MISNSSRVQLPNHRWLARVVSHRLHKYRVIKYSEGQQWWISHANEQISIKDVSKKLKQMKMDARHVRNKTFEVTNSDVHVSATPIVEDTPGIFIVTNNDNNSQGSAHVQGIRRCFKHSK
jgi:hypothetical protein